jgi:hypothetical protein
MSAIITKLPLNQMDQLAADYDNHPMMTSAQNTVHKLFLDCHNNFLTVKAFSWHYGFSEEFASALIKEGKCLNGEFNA